MKVVFAGNFGLWRKGTMGSRALPMARELRSAGHEAVLLVPPWDVPEEANTAARAWGVPIRNVAVGRGFSGHAIRAVELLRAALAERPDVLVAVKPKAYAGLLALLFGSMGRRGRRPVRLVVDADDWEGTGGWNALDGRIGPVPALVALHERLALRAADHVTVASRTLATLAESVGVPRQRIAYVPNASWPGAAGWPPGDRRTGRARLRLGVEPALLLYSRFFEFDPSRIVGVVARVLSDVPDARLVVVGAGIAGEETGFRTRLDSTGLSDRVTMVGWTPRAELPDLLAAVDVALVPLDDSLVNRARCSVKLLDLMLAGCPIVAERVGQVAEYLHENVTARVIQPGDDGALALATTDLLRDPPSARRLAEAAARAARDRFTWARQRDHLVGVLTGR